MAINLSKRLGAFTLSVNLTLPGRGVTALFGVSGSGKTSLLRLIAGLDGPDYGSVRIGEQTLVDTRRRINLPPHRRRLGVVFQEARLFPHYRVHGNLVYGMRDPARFDAIVALLGIGGLLDRLPGTLSGGEARRVAIGRALLTEPRILLMDEPLTGLDGARKQDLLRYIRRLAGEIDIPILYVSHDPEELTAIADDLVLVERGEVLGHDRLDALLTRFEFTELLGGFDASSVITATVEGHDCPYSLTHLRLDDGQRLTVPFGNHPVGAVRRLRIPVREIALALSPPAGTSYRNRLATVIERVSDSSHDPGVVELRLRVGQQLLRARLTRKSYDELDLREGMAVTALVRSVAFDSRGAYD